MRSLRSLRAPAFSPARSLLRPRPPLLLAPAQPRFLCVSAQRCSLLRPRPPLLRAPPAPPRRWLCSPPRDPYTVLNVKRDATAAEIKAAYFKIAKRHHPDVNKSADAPRVFREAAEAYEVLRDASSRRAYDASGARAGAGAQQQQQQQWQQQQYQQRRPQDSAQATFQSVWRELGMADIDDYIDRVKYELGAAMGALTKHGDSGPAWTFAKEHRGLVIGTLLPAFLLLRVPALMPLALRLFGPMLFVARILPPRLQWYFLSRLWVAGIRHAERLYTRVAEGGAKQRFTNTKKPPGGGGAG